MDEGVKKVTYLLKPFTSCLRCPGSPDRICLQVGGRAINCRAKLLREKGMRKRKGKGKKENVPKKTHGSLLELVFHEGGTREDVRMEHAVLRVMSFNILKLFSYTEQTRLLRARFLACKLRIRIPTFFVKH